MNAAQRRAEHGASAVEYVLLVSAVAVVILVAIFAFYGTVSAMFHDSCNDIANQTGQAACSD